MTDTIEPRPTHDEMPDHDPVYRRKVCDLFIEASRVLELPLGHRILRLLTLYEEGELSIQEVESEIRRPRFH